MQSVRADLTCPKVTHKNMDFDKIIDIGVLGIVVIFAIKETFAFLKSKKNADGPVMAGIFKELQTMNNNHLHTLQDTVENNNKELIRAIDDGNRQMIEILGRIDGKLSK